jgi:hypothetical protein
MINSNSTKTSIFDVPELKYTALAAQIKAFKLDGNTPSDVCWTALRRIAQLPEELPKSERKSKIPLKEEPEFNKKEVINYIKETLGLEELSKFVDEVYKESNFKGVSWDKTEISDEQIRRLQGIDPTKVY